MTTANMLSRVRTFIEESSAAFYTDAEIYSALTDGQQEVANHFYSAFKASNRKVPHALAPIALATYDDTIVEEAGAWGGGAVLAITSFWDLVSAKYATLRTNTAYPCEIYDFNDKDFKARTENSFLAPTIKKPIAVIKAEETAPNAVKVFFFPNPSGTDNGAAYAVYLKTLTAIASGVNPSIADFTHEAIVQYAIAFILNKDQRTAEAQAEYAKFDKMLKELPV